MDIYVAKASAIAVAANSTKTLLQLATPSTIRAKVTKMSVSFDSATAAQGLLVELLVQTSTGTMSALTPAPLDQAAPASLVTAAYNATVEPTASTILKNWYVPPAAGLLVIPFDLGEEIIMPVSTRLGLRVTAPTGGASPNAAAALTFQA